MIYNVTINDKVYEVEVEKGKANLLKTTAVVAAPAAAPAEIEARMRIMENVLRYLIIRKEA